MHRHENFRRLLLIMIPNRTSQALDYYFSDFHRDGERQQVACPKNELWAIADKYRNFEAFIELLRQNADYHEDGCARATKEILDEILAYDPLQ